MPDASMIKIPLLEHWLGRLKRYELDDAADRLSYYATAFVFAFFALATCGKLYLGAPMQCWGPAEWPDRWRDYARDYCFAKNTYYVPPTEDIPRDVAVRKEWEISYYQWVPLMLAIQALAFYLPSALWQLLCWQAGMDAAGIVRQCVSAAGERTAAKRRERAHELAAQMAELIGVQRTVGARACRLWPCQHFGRVHGVYLCAMYLLIKVLYVANALCQLYVINSFLGAGNALWGWHILSAMLRPGDGDSASATRSPYFPISTMCDFTIREVGNENRQSLQCVIMANIFHEKIYVFLWFWLLAVAVVSLCALAVCVVDACVQSRRMQFVCKHLRLACATGSLGAEPDRRAVASLVTDVLRPDGVMLLRFVATQAGDVTCADVCAALWRSHQGTLAATGSPRPPSSSFANASAPDKAALLLAEGPFGAEPSPPMSATEPPRSPTDGYAKRVSYTQSDGVRSGSWRSVDEAPAPPAGYEGYVEMAPAGGDRRRRHYGNERNGGGAVKMRTFGPPPPVDTVGERPAGRVPF